MCNIYSGSTDSKRHTSLTNSHIPHDLNLQIREIKNRSSKKVLIGAKIILQIILIVIKFDNRHHSHVPQTFIMLCENLIGT